MSNETILGGTNINRLRRVNETLTNSENKSFTETLENFRQISDDYQEMLNDKIDFSYSDYEFNKCSKDEQLRFFNEELQFIETLIAPSIYTHDGRIGNWWDIYKLLYDPEYAKVEKSNRKVVYPTAYTKRPVGDAAFNMWNGLQIIDLDIKDADLASALKGILFDELKKYNWFLGVCRSASKKGLHVWTKITPISVEFNNRRIEYLCNFRQKYSYVYIILSKYESKLGYLHDKIKDFLDMAMAKPQQGIFISSDNGMLNTNFHDTRLDVNFEGAFNTGIESIDWIGHPELKDIFSRLEWFNLDKADAPETVEVLNADANDRDMKNSKGPKHYKHNQRWQLANTLNKLFGADKALAIMKEICVGTEYKELKGDVRTASLHDKPLTIWAVEELNRQHGFNIEIKDADVYRQRLDKIDKEIEKTNDIAVDPTKIFNDTTAVVNLHLNSDQYLSDIKDDILKNLSHITLLEAGAGYGKTEMIKAMKGKTLLVLPFTSTIKSKVESSETTKDWLYYYGNKRPTLGELLGESSMSMTIDKFSHLNVIELDTANFEYIVIDESHLMFTSSYRDVMSPCIQRIANCKAKVIMMSGTPTGEMLFFPKIKHIKVVKDDNRIKKLDIHMVPTPDEQRIEMCMSMARDIIEGKRILYPSNKGNLYFTQITSLIQRFLNNMGFDKELKPFYYKKSNFGEQCMEDINMSKTIGDYNFIMCTTYLSVGVDICDKKPFSVYFNEVWIPQDIEQFANRLRNNDLYLKLFLPLKINGVSIRYDIVNKLDLTFDNDEVLLARDLIHTCNDVIERNKEESKYNPLIQSLLGTNRYLKYDENDSKYYIDETTYKLKVFEERYAEYSKQLTVFINGMKYYGYNVTKVENFEEVPAEKRAEVDAFMTSLRALRFDKQTQLLKELLESLTDNNIDCYRELTKGNYEMFKSNDPKNTAIREDNGLWVRDIELMEKHIPVILNLYKFYTIDTIRDIYKFCIDSKSNKFNYAKLERIRSFVNIQYNIRKKRLDYPIYKFVREAQEWATANPEVTQMDINKWVATWSAKYANSIKNVVVDDMRLFESIYEKFSDNLWKIIIVQGHKRNGKIPIKPFELEWERKDILEDVYGNAATKEFFLQELIDEAVFDEEENVEELPDLPVTEKMKLKDVIDTLPTVIHKEYEYNVYSDADGSNDRFMRKQQNNDKSAQTFLTTEAPTEAPTTGAPSLFDNFEISQTELPF